MVKKCESVASVLSDSYLKNEKSLSRFLRRFLDRPEDIQDALHDTYVRACRSHDRAPVSSPKAFLFKIAKNVAINEHAKHANSRTVTGTDFERVAEYGNSGDLTEQQAVAEQQLDCAMQAIASMSPRVRDVFVLRKVHGFRQKEIAKRLGISESTVEKHLARGVAIVIDFRSKETDVKTPTIGSDPVKVVSRS
jgi:RNA polymerase sigma-70 factor (ECF subfamily)